MKDYDESSAQYEMDNAYAACMARAAQDGIYAAYNKFCNFISQYVPNVKGTDGMYIGRRGHAVHNSNGRMIGYSFCELRVGNEVYPEIEFPLFYFKVVPTEKNVGHHCMDVGITVAAESSAAARKVIDDYLSEIYKRVDIDDSWFEIKE